MGLCASKDKGGPDPEHLGTPEQVGDDLASPSLRSLVGKVGGGGAADKGDKFQFVIVGFGVAAGYALKQLADLGVKDFQVAVIGEESTFAYERPALSKGYLFPPGNRDRFPARLPNFHTCAAVGEVIQSEEWYQDKNWTCYLNTKVLAIDAKRRTIKCQGPVNEEWVRYETLIVCTGAKPTKLTCPGANLKNVFYIRNENDSALLVRKLERETGNRFQDRKLAPKDKQAKSAVLQSTRRLGKDEQFEVKEEDLDEDTVKSAVVVGGGYLGVELACALHGWGFDEIHLSFRGDKLYNKLPWDGRFRTKVQNEIIKRAPKLVLHPKTSVDTLHPKSEGSQVLGSVDLTDGTKLETRILVAAVGASPVGKELFSKKAVTVNNNQGLVVDSNLRLKSGETKDIFICGELAEPECGVEAARKMGQYAAKCAFNHQSKTALPEPFKIEYPFRYSRLFEYTPDPIIWYQIGNVDPRKEQQNVTFLGESNEIGVSGPFGVFYSDNRVVTGGLICGTMKEKDVLDQSRSAIESGSASVEDITKLFTDRGYPTN